MRWIRGASAGTALLALLISGVFPAVAVAEWAAQIPGGRCQVEAKRLRDEADRIRNEATGNLEAQSQALAALRTVESRIIEAQADTPALRRFFKERRDCAAAGDTLDAILAPLHETAAHLDALAALDHLVADTADAPGMDRAAVRERLREELAKREYRAEEGHYLRELLAGIWEWVRDAVRRALDSAPLSALERFSVYVMTSVLVLATLLLGWLTMRQIRARMASAGPRVTRAAPTTVAMADPEAYRADAKRHAEAGRFRDALRALFLMALAELERAGLVAFDRTRTNGEYVRQLERRTGPGPLADNFGRLTQVFNAAWYGYLACGSDEFEQFADRADRTIRLVRERA